MMSKDDRFKIAILLATAIEKISQINSRDHDPTVTGGLGLLREFENEILKDAHDEA